MKDIATISNNIIQFCNPKTIGIPGIQRNFSLKVNSIKDILYISTWFFDGEEEILYFIDKDNQDYSLNFHYISSDFLRNLSACLKIDLLDKLIEARKVSEAIIFIYSTESINEGKSRTPEWNLKNKFWAAYLVLKNRNPVTAVI